MTDPRIILPPIDSMDPRPEPGDYVIGVDPADSKDPGGVSSATLALYGEGAVAVVDQISGTAVEVDARIEEWVRDHPEIMSIGLRAKAVATARPRLFNGPIVVLDLETTGWFSEKPDKDWARVVEIGAVMLDATGQEISAFSSLICPDVLDERAAPALEINGITPAMLRSAPRAMAVAYTFRHWLSLPDLGAFTPVTSYNTKFDRRFFERLDGDGAHLVEWAPCVMVAAHTAMTQAGEVIVDRAGRKTQHVSLKRACGHFKVKPAQAHRALDDARAAAQVLVALRRRAQGLNVETVEKATYSELDGASNETIDLDAIDYTGGSRG